MGLFVHIVVTDDIKLEEKIPSDVCIPGSRFRTNGNLACEFDTRSREIQLEPTHGASCRFAEDGYLVIQQPEMSRSKPYPTRIAANERPALRAFILESVSVADYERVCQISYARPVRYSKSPVADTPQFR